MGKGILIISGGSYAVKQITSIRKETMIAMETPTNGFMCTKVHKANTTEVMQMKPGMVIVPIPRMKRTTEPRMAVTRTLSAGTDEIGDDSEISKIQPLGKLHFVRK